MANRAAAAGYVPGHSANLIFESALPGKQLDAGPPMTEPTLFMLGIVALAVAIQAGLYFIFRHTRPRHQKEPRKKLPLSNWRG